MPRPEAVEVHARPLHVYAPAAGRLVAMEDIPDPVFASGAMGACVGIWPVDGMVYAPVDGIYTVLGANMPHAVAMRSDDDMAILVHVGIDTVEMRGEGFTVWAERGAHVRAGEPIMHLDIEKARQAGRHEMVITALTNSTEFDGLQLALEGEVRVGDVVMRVEERST